MVIRPYSGLASCGLCHWTVSFEIMKLLIPFHDYLSMYILEGDSKVNEIYIWYLDTSNTSLMYRPTNDELITWCSHTKLVHNKRGLFWIFKFWSGKLISSSCYCTSVLCGCKHYTSAPNGIKYRSKIIVLHNGASIRKTTYCLLWCYCSQLYRIAIIDKLWRWYWWNFTANSILVNQTLFSRHTRVKKLPQRSLVFQVCVIPSCWALPAF